MDLQRLRQIRDIKNNAILMKKIGELPAMAHITKLISNEVTPYWITILFLVQHIEETQLAGRVVEEVIDEWERSI